jgi:hypothetical protein
MPSLSKVFCTILTVIADILIFLGLSSSDKYLHLNSSSKPSKKDKKSRRKKKKHAAEDSDDDVQAAHEVSTVVDMPDVSSICYIVLFHILDTKIL